MADPLVTSAREILVESLAELRSAVAGLPPGDLNRRLAIEGSNPMAVIVAHALASTRSWVSLAVAAPPPPRDRPAEFETVADDGYVAWADERIAECLSLLEGIEAFDPAREGVAPWRTSDPDQPVTAGWALLHAISHLGEHVGHAQLMRDLLAGGHAGSTTVSE